MLNTQQKEKLTCSAKQRCTIESPLLSPKHLLWPTLLPEHYTILGGSRGRSGTCNRRQIVILTVEAAKGWHSGPVKTSGSI